MLFYIEIYIIASLIWMISELNRLRNGELTEEEQDAVNFIGCTRDEVVDIITPYCLAFCWAILPIDICSKILSLFSKNT